MLCILHFVSRINNNHLFQVDEKKRKLANSNSKGGKGAKRPKIENDVITISYTYFILTFLSIFYSIAVF